MRSIKRIVVHVSDTPDTMDIGAAEIHKWHTDPPPNGNGWSNIGYHKVVRKNGDIEAGRPEEITGAHVAGHNHDTLAVCWVGRNNCKDEQKQSLKRQIHEWMQKFNIPVEQVYGHYELDSKKTCPNLKMDEFRELLRQEERPKQRDSLSDRKETYLPDGPSEEDIAVTLEDIENQILNGK